jgi:hypothetical protein
MRQGIGGVGDVRVAYGVQRLRGGVDGMEVQELIIDNLPIYRTLFVCRGPFAALGQSPHPHSPPICEPVRTRKVRCTFPSSAS